VRSGGQVRLGAGCTEQQDGQRGGGQNAEPGHVCWDQATADQVRALPDGADEKEHPQRPQDPPVVAPGCCLGGAEQQVARPGRREQDDPEHAAEREAVVVGTSDVARTAE
jgi:hypothetical protein